jgi:hypothetical protein
METERVELKAQISSLVFQRDEEQRSRASQIASLSEELELLKLKSSDQEVGFVASPLIDLISLSTLNLSLDGDRIPAFLRLLNSLKSQSSIAFDPKLLKQNLKDISS